jgi:hypothetical protein
MGRGEWIRTTDLLVPNLGKARFACFCRSLQITIPFSFLHSLNDFRIFPLVPSCTGLPSLNARKGQEKGKVGQVLDFWFAHW